MKSVGGATILSTTPATPSTVGQGTLALKGKSGNLA